jgi:hypothetical protein
LSCLAGSIFVHVMACLYWPLLVVVQLLKSLSHTLTTKSQNIASVLPSFKTTFVSKWISLLGVKWVMYIFCGLEVIAFILLLENPKELFSLGYRIKLSHWCIKTFTISKFCQTLYRLQEKENILGTRKTLWSGLWGHLQHT